MSSGGSPGAGGRDEGLFRRAGHLNGSLASFLLAGRVLGITPYSLRRQKGGVRVTFNWALLAYGVTLLGAVSAAQSWFLFTMLFRREHLRSDGTKLQNMDLLSLWLNLACPVVRCAAYLGAFLYSQYRGMLALANAWPFVQGVGAGRAFPVRHVRAVLGLQLSAASCLSIATSVVFAYQYRVDVAGVPYQLECACHALGACMTVVADLLLLDLVLQMRHQFGLVNEALEDAALHMGDPVTARSHSARSKALSSSIAAGQPRYAVSAAAVSVLRDVHAKLAETMESLNDAFQLQTLFVVVHMFVIVLANVYSLVDNLFSADYADLSVNNSLRMVLSLAQTLSIVRACDSACAEGNRSSVLVHNLMNAEGLSDEETNELELFSMQLLHKKLAFSVCGLFSLDFSLVFEMIAAVTTYLVVLIQFEAAARKSC